MTYQLHHGDMLNILPMMERESIDAIVTDPPYGLGFMGKDWDHGVPGEHFWREAYRVAKPGAHLLAFGGTRTFHRLACAIEDAGWEIRDTVMWVYGQGFPKSHDVSKAIDREAGAERERNVTPNKRSTLHGDRPWMNDPDHMFESNDPATPAAQEWDGWGTALKPAWEPILVARKPLQGTVAENVQRYGCGAMNIDACRIETAQDDKGGWRPNCYNKDYQYDNDGVFLADIANGKIAQRNPQGRWPANLIHDGSAEVLAGFPMTSSGGAAGMRNRNGDLYESGFKPRLYTKDDSLPPSTGSAARFFYCSKASKQDRDEGCEGLATKRILFREGNTRPSRADGALTEDDERWERIGRNHHPTVKPTALMRYLCRLVTPPNGVILDPFMGSGSTGKAAILEGFNFIGIDTEIEYVEIAARRIEHACEKVGIMVEQPMMFETKRETVDRPKQLLLL